MAECLPAIIVLVGIFWLPYSPRWLLEQERDDEALAVLRRLHGTIGHDEAFFRAEFAQMRDQLRYEKSVTVSTWKEVFARPSNRKRVLLAVLVQAFTQLSGINVINYYQTDLYKGLGMRGHTVTLLAGYVIPWLSCIFGVWRFWLTWLRCTESMAWWAPPPTWCASTLSTAGEERRRSGSPA